MDREQFGDCIGHARTLLDDINEAVLKLEFRSLEARGELLAGCLLNDTLTCKADQCLRLRDNDIADRLRSGA